MHNHDGFTLIEALLTTLILVTGLTAIAAAFSYSVQSIARTRQQTAALTLLSTKMETLKATDELMPGTNSEFFSLDSDGGVMAQAPGQAMYIRTWQVTTDTPRRVTVVVLGKELGRRGFRELARATTSVGPGF